MEQIPTAKQVFYKMLDANDECTSTEMMIEFAKMHIENFAKDFNLSCDYRKQLVETYIKRIV